MISTLWQQAYLSDSAEVRHAAQQTIFVLVLAPFVLFMAVLRPEMLQEPVFWAGVVVAAVVTVVGLLRRLPEIVAGWALPLGDLLAVALLRTATLPEGSTLSFLAFFPAIWLVVTWRGRGVVVAVAASVLTVTVPSVLEATDADLFILVRNLLHPTVVAIMGIMVLGFYQQLEESRDQQRRLTQEAQRSERLVLAVGDAIPVAVLVMDDQGNDIFTNAEQRRVHAIASPPTNTDRTEAGHLLYRLDGRTAVPPEERPARRAAQGEEYDAEPIVVGAPGGEQCTLSVSARNVLDETGTREATVVVFTDTTRLRELMTARDEFFANVSHELRTPLTSIVGYTELARDEIEDSGSALDGYLEVIERNGHRLRSLVEGLLVEQKARAGGMEVTLESGNVTVVAAQSIMSLRPLAEQKGLDLAVELESTPPLPIDPQRLAQVFDNLLSNAVKYTPRGGRITVGTACRETEVVFWVQDTGPGIADDELTRLFDPFFRAPADEMAAPVEGFGLGLGIARALTAAHGGHLEVESEVGTGSVFRAVLPRH